jgi:hypothetical protein
MVKKSSTNVAAARTPSAVKRPNSGKESERFRKSLSAQRACLSAPNVPDEALISDIGRYHVLRANSTTTQTYQELFQCAPFGLNIWIPPHISLIAQHMPGDIKSNTFDLLLSKTFFPLLQIFSELSFPEQVENRTVQNSFENDPSRIRRPRRDPIETPKRFIAEETRVCLNCLHDDLKTHGVSYIHLSHQVPGVQVCGKHKSPLIYKCPHCECLFNRPKNLVLALWKVCHCKRYLVDFPVPQEKASNLVNLSYSKFAADLLSAQPTLVKTHTLVEAYKRRLAELGYNSRGAQLDRSRLLADIEQFYGADFVGEVDPAYREQKLSGWFMLINEKSAPEVPLGRHLLFAHFLFRKAAQFWQYMIPHEEVDRSEESVRTKSQKGQPRSGNRKAKSSVAASKMERLETLKRELLSAAREIHGCTTEDLWRKHFQSMKMLVRLDAEAVFWLKEQLKVLKPRSKPKSSGPVVTDPKDGETAAALIAAAERIYASVEKPIRVSGNVLRQETQWNPYAPNRNRYPLTQHAYEELIESSWHFYARRIVWAMLNCKCRSKRTVNFSSGVEYHRTLALLDFFEGLETSIPLEVGAVAAVLKKYEINRHWAGPCPERQFPTAGRSYYTNT